MEEPAVKPQFEPRALVVKWARDNGGEGLPRAGEARKVSR